MSIHKTTHELEKRLEQLQLQIIDAEVEIGNNLFLSNDDCVNQHQEEFLAYQQKREQLCSDIEEIRALSEKRQQFRNDSDSLRQQMDALASNWTPLYENLGTAIADAPNVLYDMEFDAFREPIAELRQKNNDARVALDNLKDQMANQSFMNRLLTQVQYTSRNKAISQLEKKLAQLYIKCGKVIFESGVLTAPFEEGNLPDIVSEACIPCNDMQVRSNQLQEQIDNCLHHLEENKQALMDKGVTTDNPDKRIKAINQEVDQEIQKQSNLCQACGHDFVARYIDPEGDLLEEYTGDNNVISEKLQQIILLKRDKVVCSRKIQIINLSNQIDGISKKITSFRASIADNQEKIATLQSRNQELEDKITLSLSEKEKLAVQLSELELADTNDTKRLEE
jgi:predicted RNase H-like nuclease (RuvC/YqgF family)